MRRKSSTPTYSQGAISVGKEQEKMTKKKRKQTRNNDIKSIFDEITKKELEGGRALKYTQSRAGRVRLSSQHLPSLKLNFQRLLSNTTPTLCWSCCWNSMRLPFPFLHLYMKQLGPLAVTSTFSYDTLKSLFLLLLLPFFVSYNRIELGQRTITWHRWLYPLNQDEFILSRIIIIIKTGTKNK